jgi:hypothetical protein
VRGERARGALLYGLFAILLVAGGAWFVRAAPPPGEDPQVTEWRRSALESLPDLPFQVTAETVVVAGDRTTERTAMVDSGSYTLTMICLGGGGQVRARVSSTGDDTGRAVPCGAEPISVTLRMGLATEFLLRLSGETDGDPAVFRWRLNPTRGF